MYQHKLLVAKPKLVDPVFGGRVVFIAKYDPDKGAEGFILNGPKVGKVGYGEISTPEEMPKNEKEVMAKMESGAIDSVDLYTGGPCLTKSLYMVHGYKEFLVPPQEKPEFELGITFQEFQEPDPSNVIMEGLYFGNPNIMAQIVASGKVKEGKFRFFTGIAGWSAGQLESEIAAGAWDVQNTLPDIVFNEESIAKLIGGNDEHTPFWPQPSLN